MISHASIESCPFIWSKCSLQASALFQKSDCLKLLLPLKPPFRLLYHFKMTNILKYRYSPLVSLNCGLWTAAVKHFIADSTWLIGILDEWTQNRFVNKWTISRLQASFLDQGKHNLVFHFFNWEKTLLRLIGIYLWYSFNRKVSGIWAHDFVSPSIQDLSF